jgi:hypothetical protein
MHRVSRLLLLALLLLACSSSAEALNACIRKDG